MLTPKRREVLTFIVVTVRTRGVTPTRAEISGHFGWSSPNAADEHVRKLAREGFLKIEAGHARGIVVTGKGLTVVGVADAHATSSTETLAGRPMLLLPVVDTLRPHGLREGAAS